MTNTSLNVVSYHFHVYVTLYGTVGLKRLSIPVALIISAAKSRELSLAMAEEGKKGKSEKLNV